MRWLASRVVGVFFGRDRSLEKYALAESYHHGLRVAAVNPERDYRPITANVKRIHQHLAEHRVLEARQASRAIVI